MMTESFDENERKGATDAPCDEAKRYTDGDLRLAAEEIDKMLRRARYASVDYSATNNADATGKITQAIWALEIAHSILLAVTKEKLTTQEAGC